MPIEDDEHFDEWNEANEKLKEAMERFEEARRNDAQGLALYEKDIDDAARELEEIRDKMG